MFNVACVCGGGVREDGAAEGCGRLMCMPATPMTVCQDRLIRSLLTHPFQSQPGRNKAQIVHKLVSPRLQYIDT